MKKIVFAFLFMLTTAWVFAQSHTYDACCRYGKGNVTGDCICPACKKDKNDNNKALQEEAKQQQAKAAAENAQKEAEIKKANDEAAKKKESNDKEKKEIIIYSPKINYPTINGEREYEKIKINSSADGKPYLPNKSNSITVLYNKKVTFNSSKYNAIRFFRPNILEATLPSVHAEAICADPKRNLNNLLTYNGEILKLGSYSLFSHFSESDDGLLLVGFIGLECVEGSNEEFTKSRMRVKTVTVAFNNLTSIIEEKEFFVPQWCDCNGN